VNDQRSLHDQQVALRLLAVQHGLYDAADWLEGIIERHAAGFSEPLEAPLPPSADGEREDGKAVPREGDEQAGKKRHRGSLPAKGEAIDAFVRSFFTDRGYGPSYREIGRGVGLRSTSTVQHHVHSLVHAGRLRLLPNRRGVVPA
jgi:LexA DNA binding domain-containing protein